MKRPEAFFKMKTEKDNGTLTQLPNLHPSSLHEPDRNCEQCQGTGWIIYPPGHFKMLESKFKYDGHDTTFCDCTYFTKEFNEIANSMIKKTVSKLQTATS